MRTARLKFCTVEQREDAVWTVFDDGTSCPAVPHETDDYREITARLGYGDDVWAYCAEHELAHNFVEEKFHNRPSRVLWEIAHGRMLTGKEAVYEEMAAQQLQRWVRARERPIVSGADWLGLKEQFLALVG